MVLSAGGGFLVGKNTTQMKLITQPAEQNQLPKANPIFSSQTATIQGEITKVNGSTLSVKTSNGQTEDFPVSSKVVIYKFSGKSPQASASSDLKSVTLGERVLIQLELKDNKYQVISISAFPPPPSTTKK